jgi:hypothetical protein
MKRVNASASEIRSFCLLAISVLSPCLVNAGDGVIDWSPWTVEVHNLDCRLTRSFYAPHRRGEGARRFLSGTLYDRVTILFTIPTRTHGTKDRAEDLGKLKMGVIVSANRDVSENRRLKEVEVGSFTVRSNVTDRSSAAYLSEKQSESVYRRLQNDEAVGVSLRFAHSVVRDFEFRSLFYESNFRIWAAMLETCGQMNRDDVP